MKNPELRLLVFLCVAGGCDVDQRCGASKIPEVLPPSPGANSSWQTHIFCQKRNQRKTMIAVYIYGVEGGETGSKPEDPETQKLVISCNTCKISDRQTSEQDASHVGMASSKLNRLLPEV